MNFKVSKFYKISSSKRVQKLSPIVLYPIFSNKTFGSSPSILAIQEPRIAKYQSNQSETLEITRTSNLVITRAVVEHDRWRARDRSQVIIAIIHWPRSSPASLFRINSRYTTGERPVFRSTRENSRDRVESIPYTNHSRLRL